HFEWLINRVEQKMSLALGESVQRTESYGLPGFVIYLGSTPTPTVRPPVHYDRQFEVLDWTRYFEEIDFSSALSLTLPLSLPSLEGTGLYWWDLTRQEAIRRGLCPPNGYPPVSAFKRLPRRLHPYRIGRGSFHSAELPHQAAFPEEFPEGEERITFQVHSLICDGMRRIYF
ncbi:hypothetical protein MK280_11800, partial [Myxococcota bacterium]|nr:hypothetical protein [Myxococcota bacterium]